MIDSPNPRSADLDDPFAQLTGSLAEASHWLFEVVSVRDLGANLRRVRFTAAGLGGLGHRPGQDVMLLVAVDGRRPVRRRYTIRALDGDVLTVDAVRHGDGPGQRWLFDARPGATVEAIAPRGKVTPVPDADWHLFVGDESALPAISAMVESLPAGATALAVVEVPEAADRIAPDAEADLTTVWLTRDGREGGQAGPLVDAVTSLPLPRGSGHAYLAGEATVVSALREALAARGLGDEQVSPKAYWGRGRANADHGEPARR